MWGRVATKRPHEPEKHAAPWLAGPNGPREAAALLASARMPDRPVRHWSLTILWTNVVICTIILRCSVPTFSALNGSPMAPDSWWNITDKSLPITSTITISEIKKPFSYILNYCSPAVGALVVGLCVCGSGCMVLRVYFEDHNIFIVLRSMYVCMYIPYTKCY